MPQASVLNSPEGLISGTVNLRARNKIFVFLQKAATVILTLKIDGDPILFFSIRNCSLS